VKPEVVRHGLVGMQVCVPADFTDEQVETFANDDTPTGISSRWRVAKHGHDVLAGSDERVTCEQRSGCVHLVLTC
jgi:hypothetical protein